MADSAVASEERSQPVQAANRDRVWKVVTRFVVATALAAAVCELVWLHLGNRLSITTDIVGFPTYADFDGYRYQYAFELAAWAFPVLAVLAYVLRLGEGRCDEPAERREFARYPLRRHRKRADV